MMLDKKNYYIDGKWVSPIEPRNYTVIDPSNEDPCAEISLGGKKDIDKAVSAAKKAFETWAFTTKDERLELLEKLYIFTKRDGQRWPNLYLLKWELLLNFQQKCKQLLELVISSLLKKY